MVNYATEIYLHYFDSQLIIYWYSFSFVFFFVFNIVN